MKSPDGSEDWIAYHSMNRSTGMREVRIQPFTWHADNSPDFGQPVASGVSLDEPSGTTPNPAYVIAGLPAWPDPFESEDERARGVAEISDKYMILT
jgi:hypothetical protein